MVKRSKTPVYSAELSRDRYRLVCYSSSTLPFPSFRQRILVLLFFSPFKETGSFGHPAYHIDCLPHVRVHSFRVSR